MLMKGCHIFFVFYITFCINWKKGGFVHLFLDKVKIYYLYDMAFSPKHNTTLSLINLVWNNSNVFQMTMKLKILNLCYYFATPPPPST